MKNSCLKIVVAALMIFLPSITYAGGYNITKYGKLTVSKEKGEGSVYIKDDDGKYTKKELTKSQSDSKSSGDEPSSLNISFECKATPNSGYKFDGWKENTSDANYKSTEPEYTYTFAASSDSQSSPTPKTLYGYFSEVEYDISYTSEDGTVGMPEENTKYKITTSNINISSAEPSRTGYNFSGWKASYSGTSGGAGWDTSTPYKPGAKITNNNNVYGNVTLTAQWNPISYTIVYQSTETCENLPEEQEYNIEKTPIVLSPNVPIREGWTFTGWTASFTNDTGSGWTQNPYQAGASITNNKDHYGNVTLTAGWEKEPDPSSIKVSITGLKGDDHAIFNISYDKQGQKAQQQIAIHEYAIVKIPGGVLSVTVEPSSWTKKTYEITPNEPQTQNISSDAPTLFTFTATPKQGQNIYETSREF